MSTLCRSFLYVVAFAVMMLAASVASAQDCNEVCDPYYSSCSDYCEVCFIPTIDGGCQQWRPRTCGQASIGCVEDNCSPNWVEQSRVTQGTYDGRSLNGCTHHVVQQVTLVDTNQCNKNPDYETIVYCDDVIDDWKDGCCYPSCCEGTGENGTQLECDGDHTCD